jgi:hypothetical protein
MQDSKYFNYSNVHESQIYKALLEHVPPANNPIVLFSDDDDLRHDCRLFCLQSCVEERMKELEDNNLLSYLISYLGLPYCLLQQAVWC